MTAGHHPSEQKSLTGDPGQESGATYPWAGSEVRTLSKKILLKLRLSRYESRLWRYPATTKAIAMFPKSYGQRMPGSLIMNGYSGIGDRVSEAGDCV
jgi:hypothetical protein